MASPIWRPCLAIMSTLDLTFVYPPSPWCRPGDPTPWRLFDGNYAKCFKLREGAGDSAFTNSQLLRCLLVGFVVSAVASRKAVNLCP